MKVAGGKGGNGGVGGAGGEQPLLYNDKANVYGRSGLHQPEQAGALQPPTTAGDKGGSGFDGKGADGVFAYSYQIDNNDISKLEIVHQTNPLNLNEKRPTAKTTPASPSTATRPLSPQAVAQVTVAVAPVLLAVSPLSSPPRSGTLTKSPLDTARTLARCCRQAQVAQVAPTLPLVPNGIIASANNAAKQSGTRNPGYVKVYLCERS